MFQNLQNYDSHLIFQEIGKYNSKINVIPKTIEKYTSYTVQQPRNESIKLGLPLSLIDPSFLNNSIDNFPKNLGENDFYHMSQEFNANALDLFRKKGLFSYDYWDSFEKSKEDLGSKDKFYNILTNCGIIDENYESVLNV